LRVAGLLLFLLNFGPLFREHKLSTANISHTSCRSAKEFGSVRGPASRHLFPEFGEFRSTGPAIPCGDVHRPFTDALVFCVCVSVCHAVKEIDELWQHYLVQGFSERDEIWQLGRGALLYVITQIGELWHKGGPLGLGRQNTEGYKNCYAFVISFH